MKAKFYEGLTPLRGKSQGMFFQNSRIGSTMGNVSVRKRPKSIDGFNYTNALCRASSAWSALSAAEKTRWNDYAFYNPEPTRLNSDRNLTGRAWFIRRQVYQMIYYGLSAPIWYLDEWGWAGAPTPELTIYFLDGRLMVDVWAKFAPSNTLALWYFSQPVASGKYNSRRIWRLALKVQYQRLFYDITDWYMSTFGRLPSDNEIIFCRVDFIAETMPKVARNAVISTDSTPNRVVFKP